MKSYKGNRFPFCCALFTKADASEAAAVIETLERQQIRCAVPKRRNADCIARSAAVLLFLSPEAVRDKAVLKGVSKACTEKKTILTVYLRETQLTPGLSLQLGQSQGIMKYREESEEAFYAKLVGAPVLQSMSVTDQQKKAMRRHTLMWAIGGTAVVALALLIGLYWRPLKAMLPNSPLRRIGVSLDFDSVETLYAYGVTRQDAYTMPTYRLFADGDHDWARLGEQLIPQGDIKKLDDFALLRNLRELCICNNPVKSIEPLLSLSQLTLLDVSHNEISDFSGIGALSELKTLNVAYNPITALDGITDLNQLRVLNLSHTDLSSLNALLDMPALETVYIDAGLLRLADLLGETPFAIVCTDTPVYGFDELAAALEDPSVTDIRIMLSMSIPDNTEITIRPNVVLSDVDQGDATFVNNYGTVRICGVWEATYIERNNYGTVIVEDGGLYTGAKGFTYSNGTFRIEKGGRQNLERGATFFLLSGKYVNNGAVYLRDDYNVQFNRGDIVNNGSLYVYISDLRGLDNVLPIDEVVNNGLVYVNGFRVLDGTQASGDTE